ncbi:class I SAM-dependent methyltransferase [Olivibacter sp. SDN3]|nr:class I SAM-dependent methyltransferase [Olivibacter sp. SDN3]
MKTISSIKPILMLFLFLSVITGCAAQGTKQEKLDERVLKFLKANEQQWQNLNVPYEDGQVLHDLIVNNNYQSALEIGTSTGHSTIWIAWALSKTGGKMITIELDEDRQQEAIKNLTSLGLADYVDFKLGDAHQLVKDLKGPFDFIFSDADKDWYIQYFKDIDPKLKKGGRFTAHNVLQNISGIREYMEFIKNQRHYETIIDKSSNSGIAISLKK